MPATYDIDAERVVIGAMLLSPAAVADAAKILRPEDFGGALHGAIFAACVDLWKVGAKPDAVLVAERLRAGGTTFEQSDLVSLQANSITYNPAPHARIVAEQATRRRCSFLAEDMLQRLADPMIPLDETLDRMRAELDVAAMPNLVGVTDVVPLADFAEAEDPPASWVIPGLVDQGDRVIVVAPEGQGKSVVCRWLATSTAQGVHPFTGRNMPPANTLLVDLENPGRIIRKTVRPMLTSLAGYRGSDYDRTRCHIWHRPGGIDLRTRAGAAELDAVCAKTKPRLVCLGPLYKAYRADSAKREHDLASEVAAVFDDLRTRHGFALVLEAHAPLKQGGVRDLRPFGSLLWQQWPEVGIKLIPQGDEDTPAFGHELKVGFYRGSRDERCWPTSLTRGDGTGWPWVASYPDDRWKEQA